MLDEFLEKLGAWSRQRGIAPATLEPQTVAELLETVARELRDDPSLFDAIQAAQPEGELKASEVARVMQLIGHSDLDHQLQGLSLLQATASADVWDALMIGAEIGEELRHSTLRMSGALTAALLLSPFADYSDLEVLSLVSRPPPDMTCLRYCTQLKTLHVRNTSLAGLSEARSVTALIVQGYSRDWLAEQCDEMVNVEELTIAAGYGQAPARVDLSLLSACPRLKTLRLVGYGVEGTRRDGLPPLTVRIEGKGELEALLPVSTPELEIEEISLRSLRAQISLRLLSRCRINTLKLCVQGHGVFEFSDMFSLLELENLPIIQFKFELDQPWRARWAHGSDFPAADLLTDAALIKPRLRLIQALLQGDDFNFFNALKVEDIPSITLQPEAHWFFEDYVALREVFADPAHTKTLLREVVDRFEADVRRGVRGFTLDKRALQARPFFSCREELTITIKEPSHVSRTRRMKRLPEHLAIAAPGVRRLTLLGGGCLVKQVAVLQQFTELEELTLHDFAAATKSLLSPLVTLPALKTVALVKCPGIDKAAALKYLANKKSSINLSVRKR